MGKFNSVIDRGKNTANYRIVPSSQEPTVEPSAIIIEVFVIACVLTLFGCFLYAFLSKHAPGIHMMWRYRDLQGMDPKLQSHARWSWWLYATRKQRLAMAELIEETRDRIGYYEMYAENGGPPGFWDYVVRFLIVTFVSSWMAWALAGWMWNAVDENDEYGCIFQVSGLGLCVWMAACACEIITEFAFRKSTFGGTAEFVLIWFGITSQLVKMATPAVLLLYGVRGVWMWAFGDYALSGPDIVVLITCALAAACYYVNRDGFSDQEGHWHAEVRRARPFAWYDKGDLYSGPLNKESEAFWDEVEESVHGAPEAPPAKLTKAQRKALARERDAQLEAERQAQKRRERQEAKVEKARARAISEAARKRPIDGSVPDVPYEERRHTLTHDQVREARRVRRLASRTLLRKRLAELESSTDEQSDDGSHSGSELEGEEGGSGSSPDKEPSHSDHVDSADLAAQTQRNKEEAERQRRVREQREKEKAEQKEKEYSEAGPSHKEGAPKWAEEPPDEGDKAKREAERQASLLRKQQQQKERVKEKEAREKRESERLQNLKTGKRILQGNLQAHASNNVQRSSLQPLREDEPEPTLTLADVALGFQEDPRFQVKDDDLESVATTAVPAMLTQHAWERAEERDFTAYQIKHTKKYGRVEEGNRPGTYVHHPRHECHPKLVTDAEGTVITVLRLRRA